MRWGEDSIAAQRALAEDYGFASYEAALRSWIATVAIVEVGYVSAARGAGADQHRGARPALGLRRHLATLAHPALLTQEAGRRRVTLAASTSADVAAGSILTP